MVPTALHHDIRGADLQTAGNKPQTGEKDRDEGRSVAVNAGQKTFGTMRPRMVLTGFAGDLKCDAGVSQCIRDGNPWACEIFNRSPIHLSTSGLSDGSTSFFMDSAATLRLD